ncbi:MAG: DUF342 domain-containing protein [Lachnospiraceae bacterium]|nr:DUF342 domain-containing protein [Lachnospiraceae bacterium]
MGIEELEKYVEVFIAPDKMSADLFMSEDLQEVGITLDMLKDFIESRGVVFGVDENVLSDAVNNHKCYQMITFANGTEVVEGRDGYFDYMFDIENSKRAGKPKIAEDGSVNYKELNIVECVNAGQVLAKYHPKVDGVNGTTVTGDIIKASLKKDMPPLRGKGFSRSEDGLTYTADIDGRPAMKYGMLEISNVFEVSGNVDLSTGNVYFNGDLIVTGNITSGMVVKTTGTITVNGMIEAADVIAGGSILVKGGILGGSKANIQSDGDVIALFIENANVRAGLNVLTDCIVNGEVYAYQDVVVTKKSTKSGKAGSIIGGTVTANRLIKADNIGALTGMKTELGVGIPYKVHREYMGFKMELENAQAELSKIENAIAMVEKRQGVNIELRTKLIKAKIDKASYVYKYREICEKAERNINMGKGAYIVATGTIHAGVILKIDEATTVIDDEYNSIVFKRKEDKIVSFKYTPPTE